MHRSLLKPWFYITNIYLGFYSLFRKRQGNAAPAANTRPALKNVLLSIRNTLLFVGHKKVFLINKCLDVATK